MTVAIANEFDPEEPVIDAIRSGDRYAFEELVRRQSGWIRAVVFGVLGDPDLVEDVVQQVWTAVWTRIKELRDPKAWRPWLYRLARNAAVDAGRGVQRRRVRLQGFREEVRSQRPSLAADVGLANEYNHACTLRRILEAAPVVQVGLRSAEREENEYIREKSLPFYSPQEYRRLGPQGVADQLSDNVYVTIDLDAFDPSQVAAVGTPEPGGLLWDEVSELLETVAGQKRIVGFDVTELAPSLGPRANAQLAAKLTYRLIGLALRE